MHYVASRVAWRLPFEGIFSINGGIDTERLDPAEMHDAFERDGPDLARPALLARCFEQDSAIESVREMMRGFQREGITAGIGTPGEATIARFEFGHAAFQHRSIDFLAKPRFGGRWRRDKEHGKAGKDQTHHIPPIYREILMRLIILRAMMI